MAAVLALGVLATGAVAQSAPKIATRTALTTETQQSDGRQIITYRATVEAEDGSPVSGAANIIELKGAHGHILAGAAVDADGNAQIRFDPLSAADHNLAAIYSGDSTHAASQSAALKVHPEVSTPSFALGIDVPGSTTTPPTMTITAPGDSGSLIATITPAGGFTGFIALSCTGPPASSGTAGGTSLPIGVSCTFTPLNVQVTSASPVSADMSLVTSASQENSGSSAQLHLITRPPTQTYTESPASPIALAILIPGAAILVFLGRKRKLFYRAALLFFVAAVAILGTTSCAARYRYLHHGPEFTGTLPGTYTLTITAQTSDGVTASATSQALTLVVK